MFDQASLGGSVLGPTALFTSSWYLYEMLDARRVGEEVRLFLQGLSDLGKLRGQSEPGYKYMLAFAYAVPDKFKSEVVDELAEHEPSECGQLVPDAGDLQGKTPLASAGVAGKDLFPELFAVPEAEAKHDDALLRAVTHRVRGKGPEAGLEAGSSVTEGGTQAPAVTASSHRTLFLGVP